MIPTPGIIGRMKKEFNFMSDQHSSFCKHSNANAFIVSSVHIDTNHFTFGKFFYELAVVRIDGMDFSRPACFFMRPA